MPGCTSPGTRSGSSSSPSRVGESPTGRWSPGYSGLASGKTRGAYDVLLDFVTVFSDDMTTGGSKLLYTLVYERDLDRVPDNVPKIDFNKLVERLS